MSRKQSPRVVRRRKLIPRPVAILLVLLVLGSLGWLGSYAQRQGLSKKWRGFVHQELQNRGVELDFQVMTLDPVHGLVARDVTVYEGAEREHVLATISKVSLDIDVLRLAEGRPFVKGLDLRDADVSIPLGPDEDGAEEMFQIDQINARFQLSDDRLEVRQADAEIYGLAVRVAGSMVLPQHIVGGLDQDDPPPDVEDDEEPPGLADLLSGVQKHRGAILEVVEGLGRIQRVDPSGALPQLNIRLQGKAAEDGEGGVLGAHFEGQGSGLRFDEIPIDRIQLQGEFFDGLAEVNVLHIESGGGELDAECRYQLGDAEIPWSLRSDIELPIILSRFMPSGPLSEIVFYEPPELEAEGVVMFPNATVAAGEDGVAPVEGEDGEDGEVGAAPGDDQVRVRLTGAFRSGRAATRGLIFDHLEADFHINGDGHFYIRNGLLKHPSGALTLQAMLNEEGYRQRLQMGMDPDVLIPFLRNEGMRRLIRTFDFGRESDLLIRMETTGPGLDPGTWSSTGEVDLRSFTLNGEQIERWEADFEVKDEGRQWYRNVRVAAAEGSATAELIAVDHHDRLVTFEGFRGRLNPVAAVRPFNRKTAEHLMAYKFREIPSVRLDGKIDTLDGTRTDLEIGFDSNGLADYHFLGEDVVLDQAVGHVQFRHSEAKLDVDADVFGGLVHTEFVVTREDGHSGFFEASGISFEQLAQVYFSGNETKGDMDVTFSYSMPDEGERSLVGIGQAVMHDGDIYAIPVFGPLSGLISRLIPRKEVAYSVAREATASFTIEDGVLRTDDFEALTPAFRIKVMGDIDIIEAQILMDARVNLRGAAGLLLNPVSRLLEFRGEGDVESPSWSPKHLVSPLSGAPDLRDGEGGGDGGGGE